MAATTTTGIARAASGRRRRSAQRATAAAVLRARLGAVQRCLRGAAAGKVSSADVHRLRIATRRASAAVDVVRTLLPRRCRRWLKGALRKIRRAAGRVRDLDILAAADLRPPLSNAVVRRRAQAGNRLQRCASRFCADVWKRHAGEAVDAVGKPLASSTIRHHVDRRLRLLTDRFARRADCRLRRDQAIHRIRVAGKKLRYAIEASASIIAVPQGDEGEAVLRRIQDRFGAATDCVAVVAMLRRWADDEPDTDTRRAVVSARRRESKRAKKQKRACVDWWTSGRRDRLIRRLVDAIARRPT